MANIPKTFELLNDCFNPEDAIRIYVTAMIHFIQGFTYMKDIRSYYEMSVLSLKYPSIKLGYDALSSLYDNLSRRQDSALHMAGKLIAEARSRKLSMGMSSGPALPGMILRRKL